MKRLYIYLLLVLMLPDLGGRTYAQAGLAHDTIVLGDQTVLTTPAGSVPAPSAGVVMLGQSVDSATGAMQTVVTSFEPGIHWLHVDADSLPLVVLDVEVDTTTSEIRDIADIERVPYTFWEIFRWVLLALVLAGAAFGVWWLVSHRQRVQQVLGLVEAPDTRTPYERASQALGALREQRLWQAGKAKEYHTELTDIVRRFIEESTDIRATDMTSDETLDAMGSGPWKEDVALLRELFAVADMVKFAKREPLPHENEHSMDMATTYVERLWEQVRPKETEEVPHE